MQPYSKWIWGKLSFHSLAINIPKFFLMGWIFFAIQLLPSRPILKLAPKDQFWLQQQACSVRCASVFLNSKLSLTSRKTTHNPPLRVAGQLSKKEWVTLRTAVFSFSAQLYHGSMCSTRTDIQTIHDRTGLPVKGKWLLLQNIPWNSTLLKMLGGSVCMYRKQQKTEVNAW